MGRGRACCAVASRAAQPGFHRAAAARRQRGRAWARPGCQRFDVACVCSSASCLSQRDKSHPTDAGHQVLAELLASALLRAVAEESTPPGAAKAAAGLAAWQSGSRLEGASSKQAALPPPMIPGNSDASTTLCAIQVARKGGMPPARAASCPTSSSPACRLVS